MKLIKLMNLKSMPMLIFIDLMTLIVNIQKLESYLIESRKSVHLTLMKEMFYYIISLENV